MGEKMNQLHDPHNWDKDLIRWKKQRIIIWSTIAVAFLTGYFHRTVIGVVADSLMRDFAIERATDLGILASIYFWTYASLQIPAGIFADLFGPRRIVSLALLLSACGAFLFAVANDIATLYWARFITTAGIGVIFVSLIKIQSNWFRTREFTTMSGLIVLIGNSGSLLSASPMALIVESWGWRSAFHLIGVFSLLMAFVCWFIIRNRPEDCGLPTVREIEIQEGQHPVVWDVPNLRIGECITRVLCNRQTWPPVIAATSLYGVYMAIVGVWWVPYLMQVHQLPRVEASHHIFLMVIGNMLGAPLLGFLSDRLYRRRLPFVAATMLFGATLLVMTFVFDANPPLTALYPIAFLIGLGVSGITLAIACVKDVNPPQATGLAAGITNSGPFIGAALMQPAFGWVLDRNWAGLSENGTKIYPVVAYENAFLLCLFVITIGLIATFFIHENRSNR
jgi:sugar phosphate permease